MACERGGHPWKSGGGVCFSCGALEKVRALSKAWKLYSWSRSHLCGRLSFLPKGRWRVSTTRRSASMLQPAALISSLLLGPTQGAGEQRQLLEVRPNFAVLGNISGVGPQVGGWKGSGQALDRLSQALPRRHSCCLSFPDVL